MLCTGIVPLGDINMRAARFYGKEDIRVEEIEEPVLREGFIKIKPAFVGICGTGRLHSPPKAQVPSSNRPQ